MNDTMSDVEKFYYSIQKHMQGNVEFEKLSTADQIKFIQAINIILQVCSARKT